MDGDPDEAAQPSFPEIPEIKEIGQFSDGVILAEIDGRLSKVMLVPMPVEEPVVRPVDEYCEALWKWLRLIEAKVEAAGPPPADDWDDVGQYRLIAAAASQLRVAIKKSNYLYRRIYKGEPHRTVPCPKHKGQWSGCEFDANYCECMSDVNVTGWLPTEPSDAPGPTSGAP
jgi:hypothetical protein